MNKTQISLILLVVYLAIIFQLDDRTMAGMEAGIPAMAINLVIVLAVVSVFIVPTFYRHSIVFLGGIWTVIYLLMRLLLFRGVALFGGVNTYLSIADLAILWVAIGLAYALTRNLHFFEELVEKLTFSGLGKRIYDVEEAVEDIKIEFMRSRRYNHSLSLIVLQPASGTIQPEVQRAVQEIQKNMMLRFLLTNLGQIISQEVRRTDLILAQGKEGRFVVLCPETTGKGVTGLAERIRSAAEERLGLSLSYGIASFPDEALTFEELVHRAEHELIQLYTTRNFKIPESSPAPKSSQILD